MGLKDKAEACGRCAMTGVTSVTQGDDEPAARNPWDGDRIEVDEDEMRKASPHVVLFGRVKRRLNDIATKLTYGR